MALTAGQRLGIYEVVSAIGKGGMGEVYRARDTKLQRDVAIKVLPDSLATDRDRLARFEREAQLLAALNHPHIAGIYGVDTAGETPFLVLELVDGDTLADRIAKGALPVGEALAIARQIADALQAAHDKGIIHRDLKPANIALTADGHVKVLDFGLAKAMEMAPAAQSSVPAATLSPTLSLAMTEAGMILGTAAYMSPEQAKGRPADKRADVWAFGCVLFEMLTGKRAFEGEDASDTLASILRGEPDWKALPRSTPGYIRDVLSGCLMKDRKARLADIAVVNYLLSEPRHARQASTPLLTRGRALAFGAVVLTLVATAIGGWRVAGRSDVAPLLMRFSIVPGPDEAIAATNVDRQLAIAPDGKHIVYVTNGGLALRPVDRLEIQRLSGNALANARTPFWSPDAKWIGFAFGTNELRKVSVTGGPPVTLCRIGAPPRGATWGPDDTIVFATADATTGLFRVPAGGGDPKALTKPDAARGETDHLFPAFLPGGRAVLFTITAPGSADNMQIAVLNLETGQYKTLVRGGSHPQYVETGHIVYAVSGTLRAVRFDIEKLDVVGDPVPVLEQVITLGNGAAEYALSRTGALIYMPGNSAGTGNERSLVWVDRSGRETPIKGPLRAYQYPRLSPDGSKIAVSMDDLNNDIWVFDLARETLTPLTFEAAPDILPAWFPDGRRILFSSSRAGAMNLFWQQADGTGVAHQVTSGSNVKLAATISRDGATVALIEQFPKTGNDLSILRVTGAAATPVAGRAPAATDLSSAQTTPLIQTTFTEGFPEISPDGRWLAYVSDDSRQPQVYVVPFPDVNSGRWQLSVAGGTRPLWATNGRELFYTSQGTIMAVPVGTGSTFTYGNATKLFDWPTVGVPGQFRTFDVSRDGQRFLMVKEAGDRKDAPTATITVVLNWVEELKQKLPVK